MPPLPLSLPSFLPLCSSMHLGLFGVKKISFQYLDAGCSYDGGGGSYPVTASCASELLGFDVHALNVFISFLGIMCLFRRFISVYLRF